MPSEPAVYAHLWLDICISTIRGQKRPTAPACEMCAFTVRGCILHLPGKRDESKPHPCRSDHSVSVATATADRNASESRAAVVVRARLCNCRNTGSEIPCSIVWPLLQLVVGPSTRAPDPELLSWIKCAAAIIQLACCLKMPMLFDAAPEPLKLSPELFGAIAGTARVDGCIAARTRAV
jgi:hypothetical protein